MPNIDIPMGDKKISQLVLSPDSETSESLSATYVRGKAGKKYAIVSGVMRNPGSGWQAIVDADHQGDSNVDSITTTGGAAVINFASLGVTKVVSFVAVADEGLSGQGIHVGSSVTKTAATVFFSQDVNVSDYVSYNGSAFVSATGSTTPSFSGGVLTISHTAKMLGTFSSTDVSVTGRSGVLIPAIKTGTSAVTANSAGVEFWKLTDGTQQITATTDMKVYFSQSAHGYVNAANITEAVIPFSNVWFMGIFETN